MDLPSVRIGISGDVESPGELFSRLNLHLYGGPARDPRSVWWETPIRWLGAAGAVRMGSAAVIWGSVSELAALAREMPDPVCIAIPWPPAAQPRSGPLAADHVVWIRQDQCGGSPTLIEVKSYPERGTETLVFCLGESQ